jgi:hypothetical protein
MIPEKRTKHPTRSFRRLVGALQNGEYTLCRGHTLGENLIEIQSQTLFQEGQMSLLNIPLSQQTIIVTRAKVIEVVQKGSLYRVRLEFSNASFQVKRMIRSFVANTIHSER